AWGIKPVKDVLKQTDLLIPVPHLHQAIQRTPPVVAAVKIEDAEYKWDWLSGTGTGILLAGVVSAVWLRVGVRRFVGLYAHTLHKVRWPLFTIACMLAIAYVTRFSGLDA